MSRDKLIADALEAAKHARHNLKWILNNPEKIDESKREDMVAHLQRMIRFADIEMKNARRAGRTSLRTRLRTSLFAFILPHSVEKG
ncbi:hypothetical protein [Paenibacillus thermotolerans]|uniref:hypothetical protein n=1 Tax=Paenibacillus thermotolerans TaxID=3027807 RepID=UPI002367C442|nr:MULTISPECIES: hypothetical protein [unclassified Paenibacillus]